VTYVSNATQIFSEAATGLDLYVGLSSDTNTTNGTIIGATADTSAVGRLATSWARVVGAVGLGLIGLAVMF